MKIRAFFLLALLAVQAGAGPREGCLTVRNDTDATLYIVVNGYNQGDVDPNSYDEYTAPYGDVKVEAYKGYTTADPYSKKWALLSSTYPTACVEFVDGDF